MRLGHIVIAVSDLDGMLEFYRETIGLTVSDVGTGGGRPGLPRIAFLTSDRHRMHHELALIELPGEAGASGVLNHFAFEVDDLNELRAMWHRVTIDPRAGGLRDAAPATGFQGDQWSIRLCDPEGNGVEVYAPTPWDVAAARTPYTRRTDTMFEPFDLALSDRELEAWGQHHLEDLTLAYWPRGQRPVPAG
jgi:catechol-2,3-dioxygenase